MKILLADDDEALRSALEELLRRAGHVVVGAANGTQALAKVSDTDVLVTDLRMPDLDGIALLREARSRRLGLEVIVMTGYGTIASAVEAMRLGARAYLTKPFDPDELLLHLREVDHTLALRAAAGAGRGDLVGTSPVMRRVYGDIDVAAGSDAPVLITGETGTGKELAARAIHQLSRRAAGPFVAVNCGAIPQELVESELFGHEAGAFTGAGQRKRGRFAMARGGTLLLDEVNSLPLAMQPKLLRAIEAREIWPLGSEHAEASDVRIIAASNTRLDERVASGQFREDLYYRLHVLHVNLPPLREHPEDIPQIVHAILARGVPSGVRHAISATALAQLLARSWPGNVRELANALERAMARATATAQAMGGGVPAGGLTLGSEHLDAIPAGSAILAYKQGRARAAEDWSRVAIRSALVRARGNTSEAARTLKMSRTALLRLINKYGMR